MRYSKECIAEVQQAVPIEDVIAEYVNLKQQGNRLTGLCPFHTEKTPSFSVNVQDQYFHCFGCKEGGSVFSFLMHPKILGVTFPEAVQLLARKANVLLPELASTATSLVDVTPLERAKVLYQKQLWRTPNPAIDYLRSRGLTEKTIQDAELGFAPDGWGFLRQQLSSECDEKALLKFGLLTKRTNRTPYDFLRNRIIFPIHSPQGRLAGFIGRTLNGDQRGVPKYLNTPIKKGSFLFGFHTAKEAIRQQRKVCLTEGTFDILLMWQQGKRNTVASLGTALTDQHLTLLRRYAHSLLCVFDGDLAGTHAITRHFMKQAASLELTKSARELLLEWTVEIALLPTSEDPASLLLKNPEEFERSFDHPVPLLEFLYDQLILSYNSNGFQTKLRCINSLARLIAQLPRGYARQYQLDRVAAKLHLQNGILAHHLVSQANISPSTTPLPPKVTMMSLLPVERQLCRALPEVSEDRAAEVTDYLDLISSPFRPLIGALSRHDPLSACFSDLPEEYHSVVATLLESSYPTQQAEKIVSDCILYLEKQRVRTQLQQVSKQFHAGLSNEERKRLEQQRHELVRKFEFLNL